MEKDATCLSAQARSLKATAASIVAVTASVISKLENVFATHALLEKHVLPKCLDKKSVANHKRYVRKNAVDMASVTPPLVYALVPKASVVRIVQRIRVRQTALGMALAMLLQVSVSVTKCFMDWIAPRRNVLSPVLHQRANAISTVDRVSVQRG